MNNKKLIIYDWDGTLMDSISVIAECLQLSFKELNLRDLPFEEAKSIIGLSLVSALEFLTPGYSQKNRDDLLVTYKKNFLKLSGQGLKFFPKVDASLRSLGSLESNNVILAVATGKSRAGLERDFINTASKDIFSTSRTIDECRAKPDPHMIEDILLETNISAENAVMVGDTTFDMQMANQAGIRKVAVSYGAHPVADLQSQNPDAIFNKFSDMHAWVEQFTRKEHSFQQG